MNKLFTTSLFALASTAAFAAPTNPMDYYTPDNVDQATADFIWDNMTEDVKGKDCYKRAQIWTVNMKDTNRRQVKSKKIFIHYTDKFNTLLDEIENEKSKWGDRDIEDRNGKEVLNGAEQALYKKNPGWDYHVAPMIEVDGQDVVLDRYLKLPYDMPMPYVATEDYKLEQTARRSTPSEWLEALTYRGEMLWNIKKKVIEASIAKYEDKLSDTDSKSKTKKYKKKLAKLNAEHKKMGMDVNDTIDIKCEKVDSMAEVDAKNDSAWCLYSVVPMYYYNEIDLRQLAYGDRVPRNYNWVVPTQFNTAENNEIGRANFLRTEFNLGNLKHSLGEITKQDTKSYYSALYEYLKDKKKK